MYKNQTPKQKLIHKEFEKVEEKIDVICHDTVESNSKEMCQLKGRV